MTPTERTAVHAYARELVTRADSRPRPSDPVTLEAVEVHAVADAIEAAAVLLDTLDRLGEIRTPTAVAARLSLVALAHLHLRRPL